MQNWKKEHIIFFLNKLQIILRLSQNECFELQKVERLFNLTKQYVYVHTYMQKKKRAVDRREKHVAIALHCGLHYSS